MKIVIPVGSLHVGGGCKVLAETANALTQRGHEVEVVIPNNQPICYSLNCKVTRVNGLQKEHIPYGDVVLPNFYTTFFPAYEAWPDQCIRFSLGYEPLWVPNARAAEESYLSRIPVISISRWLHQKIHELTGTASLIVNPGIDPNIFYAFKTKPRLYRNKQRVILYIARNPNSGYALKGFHDFQKAIQLLYKAHPGKFIVHLICPEDPITLPGIPHRIFKPEEPEQMAKLYRTADVFVSTSWFEGYSIPPLEAMACGTPVVTTDSGGVLDYSAHLKNAFVVPPKDVHAIAGGIMTVLTNQTLSNRLIRNGLSTASQKTIEQFQRDIVNAIEHIYENQIKPKQKGV